MSQLNNREPITIALPKGRLQEQVQEMFEKKGLGFDFSNRKLVAEDPTGTYRFFLVKNSDLPTYVNHGIAGLGVCGSDVIYESGCQFFKLKTFSFGSTKMCLAGMKGCNNSADERKLKIATKFTQFTRDYFYEIGKPVEIIKLNGSVELGPVLGLAPYIVDLVETGSTIKANNLEVFEVLKEIKVHLIANPSYYKINFSRINDLMKILEE